MIGFLGKRCKRAAHEVRRQFGPVKASWRRLAIGLLHPANATLHAIVAAAALGFGPVSLGASPATASPTTPTGLQDTTAERVRACTTCHGKEGRATNQGYLPRIAGKPADYLANQLISFREGRRHYPAMQRLLANLGDDYLHEIAAHFSALELPYPAPQITGAPAELLARGEALVRRGDPQRGLPACESCHGRALTGTLPAIPGLLGLPRDYLNGQLGAWQAGQRQAAQPDCMASIANRLTPADISALSTWLASQPVPTGSKAQARWQQRLPIPCGSATDVAESSVSTAGASARSRSTPSGAAPAPTAAGLSGNARDPTDPTVQRGAYLTRAGNCIGCHTRAGGPPFAGGRAIETPFGAVFSTNLTPDVATGLGAWSSQAFWMAMHEGRSRDGRLLYPAFPYPSYTRISRADSDAMLAYLRSLPAVASPSQPHTLRFPYGTQTALALWRGLFFKPGAHADDPTRSAQLNRGAYLVDALGHCDACHAPRNALGATQAGAALSGGTLPMRNWYAPSLSSAREASVADWPIADIVSLLQSGQSPRGSVIGPMAEVVYRSTQHLTRPDLEAMAAYLKTLPQTPIAPTPAPAPSASGSGSSRGATLYRQHCADCHGDTGRGVAGAYPALAGNRMVTMDSAQNLIAIVLAGGYAPSTAGNPRPYGMPPFAHVLADEDIAAVVSHVRGAWGNQAPAISGLTVMQARRLP